MRSLSPLLLLLACASASAAGPLSDDVLARARQPAAALGDGDVEWTWLGIGGLRLRTKQSVVLVDPYLTRASFTDIVLRPVTPDAALLDELLPEADAVLIGHSHYDHLADAPYVASRTGALVLGSRTTCYLSRALGALHCTTPAEGQPRAVAADVDVTRLEARHGHLGVLALFGGERSLHREPRGRVHPLFDMPHGGPQAWLVEVERPGRAPLRAFVHTTAGLDPPLDETLAALDADVAFLSASLAHLEERWAERITKAVKRGGTVVLIHHDSLWAQLSDDAPPNAGVEDLAALARSVREARPDVSVVVPRAFDPRLVAR